MSLFNPLPTSPHRSKLTRALHSSTSSSNREKRRRRSEAKRLAALLIDGQLDLR
jgi:hypothetical protein